MDDLSAFARDVLYIISGNPEIKGTKISEIAGRYYGEEIYNSRLYPVLTDLDERGLIKKEKRDDRTNQHTITPAGEEALLTRREWENEMADVDW